MFFNTSLLYALSVLLCYAHVNRVPQYALPLDVVLPAPAGGILRIEEYPINIFRIRYHPGHKSGDKRSFEFFNHDVVTSHRLSGHEPIAQERVNQCGPHEYTIHSVSGKSSVKLYLEFFKATEANNANRTSCLAENISIYFYSHTDNSPHLVLRAAFPLSNVTGIYSSPRANQESASENYETNFITGSVFFPSATHLYGLPEHSTDFALPDQTYGLYNKDVFKYKLHDPGPLYGSIPFVMARQQGNTSQDSTVHTSYSGFLWLHGGDTNVTVESLANEESGKVADCEAQETDACSQRRGFGKHTLWKSQGGILDFFMFPGQTPKEVFSQHASITGAPFLPPYFALGYHQSRWNYNDVEDVLQVDATFDEHNLPYDVLWLDIEHTDRKKYFTWDTHNFPEPEKMQHALAAKGRYMVAITDPHIKRDMDFFVHEEATRNNFYVKTAARRSSTHKEGALTVPPSEEDSTQRSVDESRLHADLVDYEGKCWPGSSSWIDYLNPKARSWYASLFSYEKYHGSTPTLHTWIDMNEPSVFDGPDGTLDGSALHLIPHGSLLDSLHRNDTPVENGFENADVPNMTKHYAGNTSSDPAPLHLVPHREVHNLYGFYHTMATYQGLLQRNLLRAPPSPSFSTPIQTSVSQNTLQNQRAQQSDSSVFSFFINQKTLPYSSSSNHWDGNLGEGPLAWESGRRNSNAHPPSYLPRPFLLTRSFFAGTQRFAAVWTGDNHASWSHLAQSLPMLLSLSVSNLPFVGADIPGFFGNPGPELATRWYQLGAFYPFCRAHGHIETKRREPWSWDTKAKTDKNQPTRTLAAIRQALKWRYFFLPYFYTTLYVECHGKGMPLMRPLFVEFPQEKDLADLQSLFMMGSALLVCPVLRANAGSVSCALPRGVERYEASDKGNNTRNRAVEDEIDRRENETVGFSQVRRPLVWYAYPSGVQYAGGGNVECAVGIQDIPLFLRAGSVLPVRYGVRRSTAASRRDPLTLLLTIDPDGEHVLKDEKSAGHGNKCLQWDTRDSQITLLAKGELYEDDGETFLYRDGNFVHRSFKLTREIRRHADGSSDTTVLRLSNRATAVKLKSRENFTTSHHTHTNRTLLQHPLHGAEFRKLVFEKIIILGAPVNVSRVEVVKATIPAEKLVMEEIQSEVPVIDAIQEHGTRNIQFRYDRNVSHVLTAEKVHVLIGEDWDMIFSLAE